jgi:DNA excision repair protein ERCC-4
VKTIEDLTCPFIIVCDTREQCAYTFTDLRADAKDNRRPLIVHVQRGTLDQGDYSVLGFEAWMAVERKSAADLFGTLASGRRRFERELARLQALQFAAVVVEAEWSELMIQPPRFSNLNPRTVFRSVVAWQQRFNRVHWNFLPGRRAAEAAVFRILERYWKDKEKGRHPLHEGPPQEKVAT